MSMIHVKKYIWRGWFSELDRTARIRENLERGRAEKNARQSAKAAGTVPRTETDVKK